MPKDIHQFACPCCGKQIEINIRTGHARAKRPDEAKGGQDLDHMLKAQKRDSERLDKVFDEAKGRQSKQQDALDDLLRKAKEDALKNPDEDLRRPWDMD